MGNRPPAAIAHGADAPPPLVAHLVSRLDTAAAGLLDLLDHAPAGSYRHAVVCLGGHSAAHAGLRERGVEVVDLARRGGAGFYLALYRALRALAPDLVHTRSLGNLDAQHKLLDSPSRFIMLADGLTPIPSKNTARILIKPFDGAELLRMVRDFAHLSHTTPAPVAT